jgi:IS1 family transposase
MTGVHRDTICRLLVRVGEGCESLMNDTMHDLACQRIQVDEIWSFVGKKQRRLTVYDDPSKSGDMWTFVAIDAHSKLIPCYRVGKRTGREAQAFIADLESRLSNRVQLSSDALAAYVEAVEQAFGNNVDYGQIVKSYEADPIGPGRYSPPRVVSVQRTPITGAPDHASISTFYVERQNLTMRMSIRRFTRLTNAFSRKVENLRAAVALHFAHYNFVRIHKTLRITPAMEAGISNHLWSVPELLDAAGSN